ncbi:MAG: hypothetical protein KDL87_16120 [Verrucomicrobiae bacterium]|nr:hypothetical protein [Verrucomicrobiae bacterium]
MKRARRSPVLFPWFFAVAPVSLGLLSVSAGEVVREPLVLKEGGTPEMPVIFDGKGMVIDLGIDVTDQAWKREGDLWTSEGPLLGRQPIMGGQLAGLFLDEVPLMIPRDLEAEKAHPDRKGFCYVAPEALQPGQMGYLEDGSLYFRWPAGKTPSQTRLILPPAPGISGVTIACSHIVVRNVTAIHAANDGFNIHGRWKGIRLENVKAFSNADEGISAHDDVEMAVDGAEVAWNGSLAGGVADVGACVTSYRNCVVHDNLGGAFHFSGKSHRVSETVIYRQHRDFSIAAGTEVERERVEWRREPGSKP